MEARAKEMAGNEEQLRRLKEEGDRLAAEAKQRQEELEKVRSIPTWFSRRPRVAFWLTSLRRPLLPCACRS